MTRLRSRKNLESDSEKNDSEDDALDSTGVHGGEKESEIDQTGKHLSAQSSESDDEAPESVSLSTSKGAAIAQIHEEKTAINSLKEKEKQRRRNKDEILRKQKEMRLSREKSRIPDEILLKVAEKQNKVADQQETIKPNVHMTFDDDDDDDETVIEREDEEPQKGLQLVVLNQTKKRKRGVLDSANAFLNNHFYGDRLKRVDTLSDENRKRKKKYFGPALKFSKTS